MTQIQKHTFTGHDGAIYALVRHREYLYSASADKMIARWNLNTLEPDRFAIKVEATPYSLCAEEIHLLVGDALGCLHVFDLEQKIEVKNLILHKKGIFSIIKTPNGYVTTSADGDFCLLDQNFNLLQYHKFSTEKIRKALYHQDMLYFFCNDGSIYLYSLAAGTLENSFYGHELGCNVGIIHQEHLITAGKDAHLKVWDLKTHQHILSIPAHNYAIYDLQISPCGRYLASASRDKTIKVWSLPTLDLVNRLDFKQKGHTHSVNALIWDNLGLVSASDDRKIKLWESNLADTSLNLPLND